MVTVGAGSTGSDIIGLVKPAAGMVPASYRVSSLIAFISARIPLRDKRNTRMHDCAPRPRWVFIVERNSQHALE